MRKDWKQDNISGQIPVPDRAFTHGGVFHADDVFSAALLKYLNPQIQIVRGMQTPKEDGWLVFDIGGGAFDHHQADRRYRKDGTPYAAFGLLWEAFGTRILCREDAERFDREFIRKLDESDNTGVLHEIAAIVHDFNPTWEESMEEQDRLFLELADMAVKILERRFCHIRAARAAYEQVRAQIREQPGKILRLERALPWKDAVIGTDVLYVICPSLRGGYSIQAAPMRPGSMELKKPFPESWRGKSREELAALTGIQTFSFCHQSGFLCAADRKEDAEKIAKAAAK